MAQYGGEQYAKKEGQHNIDEYGNNPVHLTAAGDTGATNGTGAGYGHEQVKHASAGTGDGGVLHRSGSGSSSSSEDDGQGGRRKKKGVVEKIKEKLPGGGGDVAGEQKTATPGTGGDCGGDKGHEKEGLMDKIKEKLPGGHTQ